MKIYGYLFQIRVEDAESGYIAYAPGVGGIYEEGKTREDAISNAYDAACAILETRIEENDPITKDNPYLVVLTSVPHLDEILKTKPITDGYIATPHCMKPVLV